MAKYPKPSSGPVFCGVTKIHLCLFVCAALLLGMSIGALWQKALSIPHKNFAPVDVRADSSDYEFINPLIFSKTKKDILSEEFEDLNTLLKKSIGVLEGQGKAKDISVYYRDLNTSHWTGVNEDAKYDPSSLLKVVTLVSYLKRSLINPALLTKTLYYRGVDETGQYYKGGKGLLPSYHSVSELLEAMIVESDNTAKSVLTDFDTIGFQEVYRDFQLPLPATLDTSDYMSARSYSVIFRALYNSTYLPWDVSEKALGLLSVTTFDKGIVAGTPEGTKVSHKFGEHTYVRGDGSIEKRELHDCGIVYLPAHPYFICIMTQGKDFGELEKVISSLSESVYKYVKDTVVK